MPFGYLILFYFVKQLLSLKEDEEGKKNLLNFTTLIEKMKEKAYKYK